MDYIITESPTINAGGSVTVEAGNFIKFNQGIFINVYGTLNAAGTPGNDISFTRNGTTEWSGLQYQYNSSGNLQYCSVEYAKHNTGYGVYAYSVSSLTLNNCIIQNNDYGFLGNSCSPNFVSINQFIHNTEYGIYLTGNCSPTFGSSLSQWNDIYGNGFYDLRNGIADITADYVYWGTTSESTIASYIYDKNDNASLGYVDYNPWTDISHSQTYGDDPTPVILSEFFVSILTSQNVLLEWTTQSETNNSGWNIFRGEHENALQYDEVIQLNNNPIPGSGTVSGQTEYTFSDHFGLTAGNDYWYWLESRALSGTTQLFGPIRTTIPNDDDNPENPYDQQSFGLYQNYPNPFGSSTTISFLFSIEQNQQNEQTEILIYNMKGQLIRKYSIFNNQYSIQWDGKDSFGKEVSSGVYFYKLKTDEHEFIKKMIKKQ